MLYPTFFSSGSDLKGLTLAGAGGTHEVVANIFLQRLGITRPPLAEHAATRTLFPTFFSPAASAATRRLFPTFFLQRLGMERPASGRRRRRPGRCFHFFPSGSEWKPAAARTFPFFVLQWQELEDRLKTNVLKNTRRKILKVHVAVDICWRRKILKVMMGCVVAVRRIGSPRRHGCKQRRQSGMMRRFKQSTIT